MQTIPDVRPLRRRSYGTPGCELAAEAPAVKTAVINEVHQTIDEVRMVRYELEDIDRGMLKQEITAKENVFEEIRMDMEEHEY